MPPPASTSEANLDFLQQPPPFSKGEIDRLGQYYAGLREEPPSGASEVVAWYSSIAEQCASEISRYISQLPSPQQQFEFTTTRRVKSRETLKAKVLSKNIQLSQMQDFAGVRFSIECLHDDLRDITSELIRHLRGIGIKAETREYLETSQQGYRAIHLWINAPAGRVEVQFRTRMQNAWANTFEKLADLTGRRIRYEADYVPEDTTLRDLTATMFALSDRIYEAEVEEQVNRVTKDELHAELSRRDARFPNSPDEHRASAAIYQQLALLEHERAELADLYRDVIDALSLIAISLKRYSVPDSANQEFQVGDDNNGSKEGGS